MRQNWLSNRIFKGYDDIEFSLRNGTGNYSSQSANVI